MLALCLMLSDTYYAKNYAGIIGLGLVHAHNIYKTYHFNALDQRNIYLIYNPVVRDIYGYIPENMYCHGNFKFSFDICLLHFTLEYIYTFHFWVISWITPSLYYLQMKECIYNLTTVYI